LKEFSIIGVGMKEYGRGSRLPPFAPCSPRFHKKRVPPPQLDHSDVAGGHSLERSLISAGCPGSYGPVKPLFDKIWRLPDIEAVALPFALQSMMASGRRSHHALALCFDEQFYGPVIPPKAILL
jgi:hypothetical protein